ncbi:unnamed protein product [Bursaphelenchus xylophilus]|uniref:(pine wood nematode) hypothetical protein n=1 Tax=Bursaphelenchus xylophilus TaxID=6326 RepID=A0A1I7S385_BURXY|nr:unnamed protein product [Bursaphelenchus xylophilus]CAG9116133.1 unnamed protein product [Bursaphelenchus xylophilus]
MCGFQQVEGHFFQSNIDKGRAAETAEDRPGTDRQSGTPGSLTRYEYIRGVGRQWPERGKSSGPHDVLIKPTKRPTSSSFLGPVLHEMSPFYRHPF